MTGVTTFAHINVPACKLQRCVLAQIGYFFHGFINCKQRRDLYDTADRNGDDTYDGAIYFLNYEGPGNLWGIPHEGVDLDGDSEEDRWYPLFSIEDGVMVGPTGEEYVIKATEMEQTLQEAPGECGALSLDAADSLVLPTEDDFTTPDIGEKPVVNDPPAVVEGEVQLTE